MDSAMNTVRQDSIRLMSMLVRMLVSTTMRPQPQPQTVLRVLMRMRTRLEVSTKVRWIGEPRSFGLVGFGLVWLALVWFGLVGFGLVWWFCRWFDRSRCLVFAKDSAARQILQVLQNFCPDTISKQPPNPIRGHLLSYITTDWRFESRLTGCETAPEHASCCHQGLAPPTRNLALSEVHQPNTALRRCLVPR